VPRAIESMKLGSGGLTAGRGLGLAGGGVAPAPPRW
jgi:hypothetical protein